MSSRDRWSYLIATACLTVVVGSASAHLSIIRQGYECAGANEAGDQSGFAVAAGDFNGDGFEDLAMGAVHEDIGSVSNAGAVIVSWGSEFGIAHVGSAAYTADDMTSSVEAGEAVGHALAAGDFNGDGIDDLAIGAPFSDLGTAVDAGVVYVMRGTVNGLWPWFILDQADLGWPADRSDHFGFSLAAGNFNLDQYEDLAIGCPGLDGNAGMVFYALGSVAGPLGGGWVNRFIMGYGHSQPGDRFGYDVAVGNVVGSDYQDLVVSAPFEDTAAGLQDIGRIYVVASNQNGPLDMPNSSAYYSPGFAEAGAKFGWAVDVGDVFGASYEAVAVGEPFRTYVQPDAGRVAVIPGGPTALNPLGAVIVTQDMSGWPVEGNEQFGKSVAVGYFWDPADGYEDLAVGYPGEGYNGFAPAAGGVSLFFSGPSGPNGNYGWYGFAQSNLNEFVETNDQLGHSLCFGNFDGTGFGNLASGAPGEDTYAGMTHVIAPWRQAYGLSSQRSVAYDCQSNLVFSQKPFDQVKIASTTKIMTILIAAERSQLPPSDPRFVDLDTAYTVPNWVASNVPGSQVPLIAGEWMTLEDLMYTCLMLSGNDAAFAIADLLWGNAGPNVSLPLFIQEMNDRAAALGMNGTHFHNPAGLDNEPVGPELGEHYSTPYDMGLLSRAAMDNPLAAQIAGTVNRNVTRHVYGEHIPWMCGNGFMWNLQNNLSDMTGIKGGWTPGAKITGCFAARNPNTGGTAIAGSYTTPDELSDNYVPNAAQLVSLGMAECDYIIAIPTEWDYDHPFQIAGIPSRAGVWGGGGSRPPRQVEGDRAFAFLRTEWNGEEANLRACLTHATGVAAVGSQGLTFGVSPFFEHDSLRITNVSDDWSFFRVVLPYGFESLDVAPGETVVLPPWESASPLEEFQWQIVNVTGGELQLEVEEVYWFDVTAPAAANPDPALDIVLYRDPGTQGDSFSWFTQGLDPGEGSLFLLAEHEPNGPIVATPGTGLDEPAVSMEPLTLRAAVPNPFQRSTRIGFDLRVSGDISVKIFEVGGRTVRSFPARAVEPGAWGVVWDGMTDSSRPAAKGNYFYRVYLDGRPAASGKLTLIQ